MEQVLTDMELESFKQMMQGEDTTELQKEVNRLELVITVIKDELLRRNNLML